MDDIGKIIEHIRNQKGWTQLELQKKAKISNASISEWESGNKIPKMESLAKIAKAFDMELYELLKYQIGEPTPTKTYLENLNLSEEIKEWLVKPEAIPFLEFAYDLSKKVSGSMLPKIEYTLKF